MEILPLKIFSYAEADKEQSISLRFRHKIKRIGKRGRHMEIIAHDPEDQQSCNTLCERIAIRHGEFVYSYLNRLDLAAEQKIAIIEGIEKKIK